MSYSVIKKNAQGHFTAWDTGSIKNVVLSVDPPRDWKLLLVFASG